MIIPGNPYALIKNGICTAVIAMQNYDEEIIKNTLASQDYDEVINCSELGYEIYCGHQYYGEAGVWAGPSIYQSWVLNKSSRTWEPPISYPTDGDDYTWSEEEKTWVKCGSDKTVSESSNTYLNYSEPDIEFLKLNPTIDLVSNQKVKELS